MSHGPPLTSRNGLSLGHLERLGSLARPAASDLRGQDHQASPTSLTCEFGVRPRSFRRRAFSNTAPLVMCVQLLADPFPVVTPAWC